MDQQNLVNFVKRMRHKPKQTRLVHGDERAKSALQQVLQQQYPACDITIVR
ncbi:MAG: hypothetical protein HOE61_16190 [Candidatus Marinimicrobia bacterium]|nr:hypothetical protein [Candidatus Neomarinimicrobiota bacterium]